MSNFNHFMPEKYNDSTCSKADKHAWVPTAQTKRFGRDVAVEAYCKHCKDREWSIMAEDVWHRAQRQWKELK
jgi:hypothetical protein